MSELRDRIENIKECITKKALECGREPKKIHLVAVSKTVLPEKIIQAVNLGINTLGESYIQEAQSKIKLLSDLPVSWHFIGHLQTNKAKYAVELFDLIHSVDSVKLAQELNKQAKKINKIQNILIQINIGKEDSKSGIDLSEIIFILKELSGLKNILVRGLMAIPPFFDDADNVRPYFAQLCEIFNHVKEEKIPNIIMEELSMGMSDDFEIAIEYGATLLRIGTSIFGKRN